jgi:hypothetical protein
MSEIDPLAIVGVVTGIIALLISLHSVSRVRKHVELVERQTLFQRSQVYPVLEIEDKRYSKDIMYLTLKNVGKGSAVDIGMRISVIPLKPKS